jgi:hypothetical protein
MVFLSSDLRAQLGFTDVVNVATLTSPGPILLVFLAALCYFWPITHQKSSLLGVDAPASILSGDAALDDDAFAGIVRFFVFAIFAIFYLIFLTSSRQFWFWRILFIVTPFPVTLMQLKLLPKLRINPFAKIPHFSSILLFSFAFFVFPIVGLLMIPERGLIYFLFGIVLSMICWLVIYQQHLPFVQMIRWFPVITLPAFAVSFTVVAASERAQEVRDCRRPVAIYTASGGQFAQHQGCPVLSLDRGLLWYDPKAGKAGATTFTPWSRLQQITGAAAPGEPSEGTPSS